jgi:hypothetical protein
MLTSQARVYAFFYQRSDKKLGALQIAVFEFGQ